MSSPHPLPKKTLLLSFYSSVAVMTSSRCVFTTCQTFLWLTFHLFHYILNYGKTPLTVWEEKCKWIYPYKSSPVTPSCLFSQNSELKSCSEAKLLEQAKEFSVGGHAPDPSHTANTANLYLNANLISFQWNQHYRSDEDSQWVSGETQQAKKHHLQYMLATITTFTVNTKCQLEYSNL